MGIMNNLTYISFIQGFEGLEMLYSFNNTVRFNWTVGDGTIYDDTSSFSLFKSLIHTGDYVCTETMVRWSL